MEKNQTTKKPRRTLEELIEQQNQKAAELAERILARDAKARAKLVDQLTAVNEKLCALELKREDLIEQIESIPVHPEEED